ncbi:MAG TPA: purine nucleoside permease [Opitutaceae bacterium]|jgi:purine nucleoside permease
MNGRRLAALSAVLLLSAPALRPQPIAVRVAVVVTFEVGSDTGDKPGEFQLWAEREKWPRSITVPGLDHPVLVGDDGTVGIVAGTTGRAQAQLMALILGGTFDFTKAYWLFNGIAGVDPAKASLGSAAWARYVVDGDVAYELDPRDAPASWPYGIVPIGSLTPGEKPRNEGWEPDRTAYEVNPRLVDWAYGLTRSVKIPDSAQMAAYRAKYTASPAARRPPFVLVGDSLGCSRFWHGRIMTRWADDWTRLWTGGKGNFVMSDMEDQGFANAMRRLSGMGRVDFSRVLFLRTGSNYCEPPPGMSAVESLHGSYAGYGPALESAYRVGSAVVHELSAHWDRYRDAVP